MLSGEAKIRAVELSWHGAGAPKVSSRGKERGGGGTDFN